LPVAEAPGETADELYDLDPTDFTVARDALAKRLKAEGDAATATGVKALRRPSVGAWAVNQVARTRPELVERVVEAGRMIAAALESGDRAALRAATAARRDAVRAAARAALDLAGDQHRDEVTDSFEAAATDDASAALVTAGRLAKGLRPTAVFAPLGDVDLAPDRSEQPPAPAVDTAELDAARGRARAADKDVERARRALADAEWVASEAHREVERLEG
jgi:hypothetical protein